MSGVLDGGHAFAVQDLLDVENCGSGLFCGGGGDKVDDGSHR